MIMRAQLAAFFGDGDPLGKTMRLPVLRNGINGSEEMTLVGMVAPVKYSGIDTAAGDQVYRPFAQQPFVSGFVTVRTISNLADAADEIRRAAASIDRKSTRLNSSHIQKSRMPSSA